jgi:D-glycero-D-manno-heptose 1,7-bisphosphate phosphatase
MPRPAILLDRDGVINENRVDHVKCWSEFHFIPGTLAALRRLSALDVPIVVITNQGIVNRTIISSRELSVIHRRMTEQISAAGARLDGIFYCPHSAEDGCGCRKPEPGLLLQAAEKLDLDLTRSVFVGDAATDLVAGQRAACPTILVRTGRGRDTERELRARSLSPLHTASDLLAAVPVMEQLVGRNVRVPRRSANDIHVPHTVQAPSALAAGSSD